VVEIIRSVIAPALEGLDPTAIGACHFLQDVGRPPDGGRTVFNIAGDKYRIVVWIDYPYRVVYIRFIGTHRQYDRIDAQTI